ncbi:MAG: hypothetical protein ACLPYY_13105 [Acidimicrobiales bacterium]
MSGVTGRRIALERQHADLDHRDGRADGGADSVGTAGQAEELTQAIGDAKASSWIGAL